MVESCADSIGRPGEGEAPRPRAAVALKTTKKTDHLRVTVDGERKGDEILVKSVSLD